MATWAKEEVIFGLYNPTTGSADTTAHTVKLQPQGSAYPTGAVDCSAKTVATHMYGPDSDLDDDYNYFIYVDGSRVGSLPSKKAVPQIEML